MTRLYRHFAFVSPSAKPVSYLELDLNVSDSSTVPNTNVNSPFMGFILIYEDNTWNNTSIRTTLMDWFDNILNKDNRVQNRTIFKNCLSSKQKFDQLLGEALKNLPSALPSENALGLHFLSFWYDLDNQTCYLYAVGMFDFFLFNGKVAGSPIAPLQNRSNMITAQDLTMPESSIAKKSFHLVFENGLTSDGYFGYCGLPIEKTQAIHASPLLSRVFYRLKRDASKECQREMEERLKKAFPKDSNSDLLAAFYYVFGLIPM